MKRITSIILLLALLISISACGNANAGEITTPSTEEATTMATDESTETPTEASTEPKRENGVYGSTLVLGNIVFDIPENFVATVIDENTYALTSNSGDCEIGLFVADVSELDEARVQAYLPMQHGSFVDENAERFEENTLECPVAGFSTVMNYYGTLSEALGFDVNMNVTFTDTWYAYTILFISDGMSENLDSNVETFAKFTINAEYTGSPVRFEFLQ